MEPRLEPMRIAELRQIAPGNQKGLLHGVLRTLDVPQDPVRQRIAAIALEVDERAERGVIAGARPLDQPHLHWLHSLSLPGATGFELYGDAPRRKVHSPRRPLDRVCRRCPMNV